MTRAGLLACAAITCGLGATIAAELLGDPYTAPGAVSRSTAAAVGVAARAAPADQTDRWITAILGRPLFSPHRRPPANAPDAPVASGPGLPRLAGTLVSAAGRQAIFASEGGGHSVVVGEGAKLGAWTVQSIVAGAVDVSGPDGARTIHPTFDRNAPAPVPTSGTALNEAAGASQTGVPTTRRGPAARPGK